jgi:hypothetical protein
MTVREALDSIREIREPGIPSDDSFLSWRRLYAQLLRIRAELLFQKINKGQTIADQDYQTLPCIDMEAVPLLECPCVPALGTYILRSKYPIPRFLTSVSGPVVKSVTAIDGETEYGGTTWEKKSFSAGRKYTSKSPDYYWKNDFLYLTASKTPEIIAIRGLFEDPLEVYNFPSACCSDNINDCISNLDRPFPIDRATFNAVIELVKKEQLEVKQAGNIPDTMNNSMSDSATIK